MKRNLLLFVVFVVLLTITLGVIYSQKSAKKKQIAFHDFAIEDTARVDKIFIADTEGRTILLERVKGEELWNLNGQFKARKDAVDLLLKTFLRVKMKAPVPSTATENVIRNMTGSGRKCEIYVDGKLTKIWYIGTPTPDHYGTYMLLETPELGKSTDPFVVEMTGFAGFLTPRFFTNEEEWKYTGFFRYPDLDFNRVDVVHHRIPEQSFSVLYKGGNDLKLLDANQNELPAFDTSAVKEYLLLYKKVHFESFDSKLSQLQEDSVFQRGPDFTLKVHQNDGQQKYVDLFLMAPYRTLEDPDGKIYDWDPDHLYGSADKKDLVMCQHYTFDPLIQGLVNFLPKRP
jgi:hypothetical protein